MYAERSQGFRLRPVSLGAALAINGGIIAALLLANPALAPQIFPRPPIVLIDPQPEPTPPPPDPVPHRHPHPDPQPTTAQLPERPLDPPPLPPLPHDPGIETGTGGGIGVDTGSDIGGGSAVVTPLFVAASFDPRYQDDLQPTYPDSARDAGTEGIVRLRILVAPSGKVTKVEPLSGDSVLLKAASRHALARWRFRPATRGGIPEESWKVMTVRFRLDQ